MTEREQNILRNYLAPHARSHWEWTEDGSAVVWADNRRTIAFREEVAAVLGRLAPRGLPDFAAIVTLMAACRDNWAESRQPLVGRYALLDFADSVTQGAADLIVANVLPLRIQQDARDVTEDLDRIAAFPAELRRSLEARAVLAEAAFEPADVLLEADEGMGIAAALKTGVAPELLTRTSNPDESYGRLVETIEALQRGLPRIDEASIRTRLRTSLDALPGAAEEEISIPKRARQLMARLRMDADLSALAQLAMHVLAALQMPRRLHHSDDLPVGGFSDLTNRGTFDRLLISELAQDDLTLTVRVAMNEAMYLRREVPAKAAPITRSIILDLGIRMWGLPRVYAVAVALALIASAQEHANVEVMVADGRDLEPVELLTRDGLLNTMAILHTAAHPGEAIPQLQRRRQATQGENETILITHEDVIHDTAFAPLLGSAGPLFVATVGRDGALNLYEHSAAGRRTLSEAMLDVSKILNPPEPKRKAPAAPAVKDLPAFMSHQPVPLRLPVQHQHAVLAESKHHNLVGVVHGRRVVVWDERDRGARELLSSLPQGHVRAICVDDETDIAHIIIVDQKLHRTCICSVHLDTGTASTNWIDAPPFEAVWHQSGILLFLGKHAAQSVHVATLTQHRHGFGPQYRWLNDRYYHGPDGTYAATMVGGEVRMEKLHNRAVAGIVTAPDGELCAATLTEGKLSIVSLNTGKRRGPTLNAMGARVIRSGRQGVLVNIFSPSPKPAGFDWRTETWTGLGDDRQYWLLHSYPCLELPVHTQITGICHTVNTCLWVQTRTAYYCLHPGVGPSLVRQGDAPGPHPWAPLTRARARTSRLRTPSSKLRMVQWADGSRAFADPRGMLHLKGSDASLPEITLLLTKPLGIWSSDGRSWGTNYHGAALPLTDPGWSDLLKRFIRGLR